jgi:quercetin dioxygenase-like cupin family protein
MRETFTLPEELDRRRRSGKPWLEFLRVPALSLGVYALPAGGVDPQGPHTEDEVYYVVSGRAILRVGSEDRPAGPGSLLFVAAGVTHRFHGIEEDLTALVFFAPAEGAAAASPGPATA